MEVVLYGRTSYVHDNILTFLRFSRNDYYSICLDYCNSGNFEQIKKHHIMLCRAMWCFIIIYMVAHISVALIFYLYYTHFFIESQIKYKIYIIISNLFTILFYGVKLASHKLERLRSRYAKNTYFVSSSLI